MMALDLLLALDPVELSRRIGVEPDDWQADVLRSDADRQLLNCSRQSGKSTTVATLAVHGSLYEADALTLLLSPSLRQSGELFKRCLAVYRAAGRPVVPSSETALTLTLENGSRIVSLPAKESTVRGYSGVRRLIIDEAARVPDELYNSVRPMLAVSGGQLIALSTPFGNRGWWHKEWTEGGPGWRRVEVPATECPRISASFLEDERRSLGQWWFNQEYLCQFMDAQDAVFSYESIMAALTSEVQPLFGGVR